MSANHILTKLPLYNDESLPPVALFCPADNCGKLIVPEPFRQPDMCNICEFSAASNIIHGDASHQNIFTPKGKYPHELHCNGFAKNEYWESNNVPHPPIMRSGYHQIRHIPSFVDFQRPQPVSHVRASDSDWRRPTDFPYRADAFAETNQRVLDRNISSDIGCTNLEIMSQDRHPMLHFRPLNCERCRILMSNRLIGNGRFCSNCITAPRAMKLSVPAKLPKTDLFKHGDDIDLTGSNGAVSMTNTTNAVKTTTSPDIRIEIQPALLGQKSSSDLSRPSKRQRVEMDGQDAFAETIKDVDPTITKAGPAEGNISKICSTPSCNRMIPVESTGSRCITCVKLAWKSIKNRINVSKTQCEADQGPKNTLLPSAVIGSTGAKSKKSVTWSDVVTVSSRDGTFIQPLARDVEEDRHWVSGHSERDSESINTGDNDLSEHTDESGSHDSLTVCRSSRTTAPTGLKIRIPGSSVIFCSRKCASCLQVLPTGYRGKTCTMCCALHQKIQQRRKELQDKDDITILGRKPKLIPNSRLCSASGCTQFIPPHGEYKFKRCNLCRLYQEEHRLLQKQGPIHGTKPLVDPKKISDSFKYLPLRFPTPGRCRSLDCAVVVEDGSTSCQQCVSRRTVLLKKAGIQEEHITATHKPLPEPNTYPQYLCLAFLLSDFESRLKAFLKSQTIFFLSRVNHSLLLPKVLFSFDGEYSVVALDFDVAGRKSKVDARAVETKKEIEAITGLKFAPKRVISVLDRGGVAIRFLCTCQASILRPIMGKTPMTISESMKSMAGELEIAVFSDWSHHLLPGEKTIIRFRLLG